MQFPKRIGLLLSKIALQRFMSAELADQLFAEIKLASEELKGWWNQRSTNPSTLGNSTAEKVPPVSFSTDDVLADAQNELLSEGKLSEKLASDEELKAKSYITSIIEKVRTRDQAREMNEEELEEILDDTLPGNSNYYVIWLEPRIIGKRNGRYVHFSWDTQDDRVGYAIRDFLHGLMFCPSDKPITSAGWTVVPLDLTAVDIWKGARRRYPIVKRTGLGVIGGVNDHPDHWKIVLDIMTKLMPPKEPVAGSRAVS